MSKRVANKRGQHSRNRMYARGVRRADARVETEHQRAERRSTVQERSIQAAAKEISTLKKLLATPPEKVGFFRNLFSRRGR